MDRGSCIVHTRTPLLPATANAGAADSLQPGSARYPWSPESARAATEGAPLAASAPAAGPLACCSRAREEQRNGPIRVRHVKRCGLPLVRFRYLPSTPRYVGAAARYLLLTVAGVEHSACQHLPWALCPPHGRLTHRSAPQELLR